MITDTPYSERIKNYSLRELLAIRGYIDRSKYHDRYLTLLNEINIRKEKGEKVEDDPNYDGEEFSLNLEYSRERTSNPVLNKKTFDDLGSVQSEEKMSLRGVVNRSVLLVALVFLSTAVVWNRYADSMTKPEVLYICVAASIVAFVLALITVKQKKLAVYTAPLYAVLEGVCIGVLSGLFELKYPGVVIQAVVLTFGVFMALLVVYSSGLIRPTENFKLGVASATGAIAMLYIISLTTRYMGNDIMPFIHESGVGGITFSIFVVIMAASNLVLDFDFIEAGVDNGAPKYMEWYASFGLLVTLVWLYLEILRLLAKARSRR